MAVSRICSVDGCGKPHSSRGFCKSHGYRCRAHGNPSVRLQRSAEETDAYINDIILPFDGDECLIWPFARNPNGYPRVYRDGAKEYAHRVVCEMAHGKPQDTELEAAHSCGNGHLACVNHKHLRWATRVENVQDSAVHGTKSRGERHGHAKLSESDVRQIRLLCAENTHKQVAALFGVSRFAITDIMAGRNWGWLE